MNAKVETIQDLNELIKTFDPFQKKVIFNLEETVSLTNYEETVTVAYGIYDQLKMTKGA